MATMVKLQTVTVGSGGASSIDFTNIPQTYTDLKIVLSARSDRSSGGVNDYAKITFNGSGTGYTIRSVYGDGGNPAGSNNYTGNWLEPFGVNSDTTTASVFGSLEVYIPNYTSSNNKSVSMDGVAETNAATQYMGFSAGLWSNTAAITSIKMIPYYGSNWKQYTTATLYGVKALTTATGTGKALGGDQVYTDGTYWYHIYRTVGTSSFTPLTSLTADYLVVAGGGGGGESDSGGSSGGGGGAGGIRCTVGATGGGGSLESALSLTAQAYTVTVGDGGARGGSFGTRGNSGGDSVFATITSTGGGGGGSTLGARNGGSGGGAGYATAGGGTATSGQGYAGGTIVANGNFGAGGGGGAGAVGSNSTSGGAAGAGGNGITTSISGTSTTYGGGGGGGVYSATAGNSGNGGTGGGGKGAYQNVAAVAGTANTGGGGGGGARQTAGTIINAAAGGSGIVIIRYAV